MEAMSGSRTSMPKIVKKCLLCNEEFSSWKSANRKYCSTSCVGNAFSGKGNPHFGHKHSEDNIKKMSDTRKKWTAKHGNPMLGKPRPDLEALRQLLRDRGDWTPKELLDDYYRYKYQVHKYTFRNDVASLENFDKRGKAGISGAYHIDHIYSIKDGFLNGVTPWVIGCYGNLKMIPWEENLSKQGNSDITKEELYERYNLQQSR